MVLWHEVDCHTEINLFLGIRQREKRKLANIVFCFTEWCTKSSTSVLAEIEENRKVGEADANVNNHNIKPF